MKDVLAINRNISAEAAIVSSEFKITCVTGPRQSGKTTLCKTVFRNKPYVNLENPDIALEATEHPREFLKKYAKGAIFDEVQRVPHLFNYLQEVVDNRNRNNQFILSGSNNFLMQENISQSLAGRVGYVHLLPFSLNELVRRKQRIPELQEIILRGGYPAVVTGKSSVERWMENYVQTYIERDVRQIRNISSLLLFGKFLKICAGRVGQMINLATLSREVGIDAKTTESWIGILESSYVLFRLPPFHPNFNKRVVKSSKLYFYDTGVLCYLLGLNSRSVLTKSHFYGAIFENFIIAEAKKNRFNKDQSGELFFVRDAIGNEVDLVIQRGQELLPVEIKGSGRLKSDDTAGLKWFNRVFRQQGGVIIYTGNQDKDLGNQMSQLNWKSVVDL